VGGADHPTTWRKSSYSGTNSTCVEVARTADGSTLVRNSNRPDAGTTAFTPAEMDAFVKGCKAGDFDDLTA
jgi:Domain of unknown function (DUF397)